LVLGISYECLDAHETNNAIECLKFNVSTYPTSAHAHKHLADVYRVAGEKELAIQNYKRALELDPNTDGVKEALKKLTP
jgi:Tfp pilus assembly protein PilF